MLILDFICRHEQEALAKGFELSFRQLLKMGEKSYKLFCDKSVVKGIKLISSLFKKRDLPQNSPLIKGELKKGEGKQNWLFLKLSG